MTLLETKTIKAPTLHRKEIAAATQFKEVMDSIKAERDRLMQEQEVAATRVIENEKEFQELENKLKRTIGKDKRADILASIQDLVNERENLFDTTSINIKDVMMDKVSESGVLELDEQAAVEHTKWMMEINSYMNAIATSYNESRKELTGFINHNIYKNTKTDLENTKRFIQQ